jgi:predicted nucleotidyltransferase
MSYRICANDLPAGELQADIMQVVSNVFKILGKPYFVIGATARDILAHMLKSEAKRKTADLDVTVAISSWEDFDQIKDTLGNHGFRKDSKVQQRLYFGSGEHEFTLDVVPFGSIALPDNVYSWPREPDTMISVVGFDSALKHTYEIDMDGRFSFLIPTAPALFMLKLIAWNDRSKRLIYKDAIDMDFLIRSYYLENSTREDMIPVYSMVQEEDPYIWGAAMMATDMLQVASDGELMVLKSILDAELSAAEQSRLLLNCMPEKPEDGEFDRISCGWRYVQKIVSDSIRQD